VNTYFLTQYRHHGVIWIFPHYNKGSFVNTLHTSSSSLPCCFSFSILSAFSHDCSLHRHPPPSSSQPPLLSNEWKMTAGGGGEDVVVVRVADEAARSTVMMVEGGPDLMKGEEQGRWEGEGKKILYNYTYSVCIMSQNMCLFIITDIKNMSYGSVLLILKYNKL